MGKESKKAARSILSERRLPALKDWAAKTRTPLRLLFSLTYDEDALIRARAIEAIGLAAEQQYQSAPEKVRIFMRSMLWLMTEESGGIGWYAPEAMAEVCLRVNDLFEEWARLLPQFLEEESFAPSTCAALVRLGPRAPLLSQAQVDILNRLAHDERIMHSCHPQTGALVETSLSRLAHSLIENQNPE